MTSTPAQFAVPFLLLFLAPPAEVVDPAGDSGVSRCMSLDCVCPHLNGPQWFWSEIEVLPVNAIKANGEYDRLAGLHARMYPGAHGGPAFLPWHREFLKRVELALRLVDPEVAVPYWDSTLERALPSPGRSHLFSAEFIGETDERTGQISNGPFAGWRSREGRPLQRRVGSDGSPFNEDDFQWLLNQTRVQMVLGYSSPQRDCKLEISWRMLEYTQANVNVFVGGDMADQSTSANDPIWLLQHAFLDLMWEEWRQKRQSREQRETDYPADLPECSSPAHFAAAPMTPFEPLRNIDGLSNKYSDELVEYVPRPSCAHNGCGSRFLFCDRSHEPARCAAKLRQNSKCDEFTKGESVCLDGHCQEKGVCEA